MGWDCWVTKDGKRIDIEWGDFTSPHIKDKYIDKVFLSQAQEVQKMCGDVDGWFRLGGLDCSDCARMLEKATGKGCWSEEGWSAEQVKDLQREADWSFEFDERDRWAYLSAKHFLDTCAELGLGVMFTW